MRVAIAGFGLAGRDFHGRLLAAADGLEVAAVLTRDAGRAAAARADHPGVEVCATADALWATAPDLAVVATANRAHAPLAHEAVARGIPVVVDKPLAVSADEGQALVDAARAAGVGLTVFQNRRWDSDLLTVLRLLRDGRLGAPQRFVSRFTRFRPRVAGVWREQGAPEEGGGQLLDLGTHLVDQACLLFGPPVGLYAEVAARRSGAAVDDDVFLALEHAGGVVSHLHLGAVTPVPGPRMELHGLAGGFACDGLDPQEAQLRSGMRPDDPAFGVREAPGRLLTAGGETPVAMERGAWSSFYPAVRAWLEEGGPPPVDPGDAVAVLRVLEQARPGPGRTTRSSHQLRADS
ncbi:Gfo/Idh/MocA family oxidoreductase [Conexibacter sp. SYSU D00693]|uniref:Gfo/Idh/MocA family protein n=1 Tax=Conexibacter sp. SYSU D00693 TaxID=2812560 RepID=UPI00196A9C8E|nr:Gfo/Idh/MocA family oxidoreductase [Conexibacter sp. SYSU D00693]